MWKKIIMIICALMAMGPLFTIAYAQEKNGEIIVNLEKECTLSLLQIAKYEDGQFVMKEEWKTSDLNTIRDEQELSSLAQVLKKEVLDRQEEMKEQIFVRESDGNNQIVFDDLELGAYLCWSSDRSVAPTIVSVPMYDDLEKKMIFSVTIEPKQNDLIELMVKKVDAQTKAPILDRSFEFTSYEDENCTKKIESISGDQKTGSTKFLIAHDVMYIKETKAPKGYVLSDEVIKVEEYNGVVRINGEIATEDRENVVSYEYENEKILAFVPTGIAQTLGWYGWLALISGLLGGFLLWKGHKQ